MVSPAITASFTPDYCSSLLDESSANTLCIRFPGCTPKPEGASSEAVCILPFFCLTIRGRASGLLPYTAIWLLWRHSSDCWSPHGQAGLLGFSVPIPPRIWYPCLCVSNGFVFQFLNLARSSFWVPQRESAFFYLCRCALYQHIWFTHFHGLEERKLAFFSPYEYCH